jgi:hypothetical protein
MSLNRIQSPYLRGVIKGGLLAAATLAVAVIALLLR